MLLANICLIIWVAFLAISAIIYINPDSKLLTDKLPYTRTLFTANVIFFVFAVLWVIFLFLEI